MLMGELVGNAHPTEWSMVMVRHSNGVTRRDFLKTSGAVAGGAAGMGWPLKALAFRDDVVNPLAFYPARDWEKIYRDQYKYDATFSWVCSPNDTHSCRVLAYTRNGIITRMGSQYDHQDYADSYGNKATVNWNPRQCAKGYTFHRIIYGPYRLKHPISPFRGFPETRGPSQSTSNAI